VYERFVEGQPPAQTQCHHVDSCSVTVAAMHSIECSSSSQYYT